MAADGGDSDASEQHTAPAQAAPTPPKRRNQYNLEFKLEVANQYAPGVFGRGFEALARQYGLHKSNVMAWVAKKDLMAERLAAKGGGSTGRHAFRLDGCGRKSSHSALEDELERWMRLQTASGERVRDKDIKEKAMRIFLDMHAGVAPSSEHVFKASSGWLARFKQRKNFASVDRRFSELAQKIEYLVNGQNLLLGMLQRLTPLAIPSVTPVVAAPAMVPPVEPPSAIEADAESDPDAETAVVSAAMASPEVAPAAKRRRAS